MEWKYENVVSGSTDLKAREQDRGYNRKRKKEKGWELETRGRNKGRAEKHTVPFMDSSLEPRSGIMGILVRGERTIYVADARRIFGQSSDSRVRGVTKFLLIRGGVGGMSFIRMIGEG